jgi:hypothetical protein
LARTRPDVRIRENPGEDRTHALELESGVASFFLSGVTDYPEMGRAYFKPSIGLRACGRDADGE